MTAALLSNIAALFLAILFLLAGTAHVVGHHGLSARYRRWEFTGSFRVAVGVVQLFAAFLLAVPQTRIWGGTLAAMVLFVTIVSLLNRGKYSYAVPAILAMVAIVPAMAGPL